MRAGWNPTLEKWLRRADPKAKVMVHAVVEVADDVRKRKDQWDLADSLTGLEVLPDGRVRMEPVLVEAIGHTVGAGSNITDLDRSSPFLVAQILWDGNASKDWELHRIKAWLDPNTGGGKNVDKWVCQVFRIFQKYGSPTTADEFDITVASSPVEVSAGPSAGEVTFSFSDNPPKPRSDRPIGGGTIYPQPTTFVFIWAIQSDGSPATNVGWRDDGALAEHVENSHTLTQTRLTLLDSGRYTAQDQSSVPYISLEEGSYTEATIAFTGAGNRLDLGAAPTTDVECVGQAGVPFGASITYEINDDLTGVAPWTEFADGDLVGVDNTAKGGKDLSGVTKQQEYLVRAKLTPNAGGNETPYLVALGVREITTVDLNELASVVSISGYGIDPVELRGGIPQARISVIRDGALDYRDPMTDILAANDIGDITFRLWVGHPDLDRSLWLHIDDFLIDDVDQTGVPLVFECVSPLVLARGVLPKFDTGTGKRTPLSYFNQTRKAVYDDILSGQMGVVDRYIGPGVEDTSTLLTKTIGERDRQSDGKRELDAAARMGGEAITSSQGRITVVDMHRDGSPVVIFPSDEIQVAGVSPGYRSRIPEFNVRYDWLPDEQRFDKEIQRSHGPALTKLGRARIDPPVELDSEAARWIGNNQTLAGEVAERVVDTMGAGLLLWSFRNIYPYPELELGDLIAIQTDRFVALDPHVSRVIRGAQWAIGVVQEIRDPLGHDFTIWIRSYADIKSSLSTVTREEFGVPEVIEVLPTMNVAREVTAVVMTKAAVSVRVSVSTIDYPSLATTQGETAQDVDSDGVYSSDTLATVGVGEQLFITVLAYELTGGNGSESTTMGKAKIIHQNVDVEPTTEDITDGWSASQDAGAPETGDVVLQDEGDAAYCNLEDANDIAALYQAYYDVDASALPAGKTVTVRLRKPLNGPTTTSWAIALSKPYDNGDNVTDEVAGFFGAVDTNWDLKFDITYDFSPDPGERAIVTLHGEAHATPGVQYTKTTPVSTGEIDAAQVVSGELLVARGGIGISDPTSGNLILGAGASAMTELAPGAAGGYARSSGSAWVRSSGVAAADLTGTVHSDRLSGAYSGITGLGTIASGVWEGTLIAVAKGGTGKSSWNAGSLVYASGTTTLTDTGAGAIGSVAWNIDGSTWAQLQGPASGTRFLRSVDRTLSWASDVGNADTLDGQEGSWYQDLSNATQTLAIANIALGPDDTFLIARSSANTWGSIVAGDLPSHSHSWGDVSKSGSVLADIANVTISAIAAGELLKWSGSAWINNTLVEAGIALVGHNHDATYLGISATATNSSQLEGESLASVRAHSPASHAYDVHSGLVPLAEYTAGASSTFLQTVGSTITWVSLAASKVQAGTFASGNFVFPNDLGITGEITDDFIPSVDGRDLGTASKRWDAHLKTVTAYGQGTHSIYDNGSKSANFNIDANNGNVQRVTIGANSLTLTITNLNAGAPLQLLIEWGGTYTGFSIGGADWGDAGVPSYSEASAKADWIVVMKYNNVTLASASLGHTNPT
jgi:hypothetical protein